MVYQIIWLHHMSAHAHAHPHARFVPDEREKFSELEPQAICPLCQKEMTFVLSNYVGTIGCFLYTWICEQCDIRREQAYDDKQFYPRQWHRVKYIFPDNVFMFEDEVAALTRKISEYTSK